METFDNQHLTAKEQETYQFIEQYVFRNNIAPTEREIAEGIGIHSRGVVHRYVTALANKGLLELTPNRRRNIRLQSVSSANPLEIPILGQIAAGRPIEAIAQHKTLNIADKLLGTNRFLLQVKGDSMMGDNICDGDYVICEKRLNAHKHEIAVVLVNNNDATLKRLQSNNDGTITLIPSNPDFKTQRVPAEYVKIQGIYIGLLRFHQN
ncbi:MAG: transcriptional repressor LexA [Gammaproteobacteria bacterium]